MPLRVTVLGSCRVWTPFKLLADEGRLELRNSGVYGFVHYAKEVIQQLEVMAGRTRIPTTLAQYISHKRVPATSSDYVDTPRYQLDETDLLIVEISSLKEICFNGYYLQINRVREQMIGESELLRQWWRELYEADGSTSGRRRYLAEVPRSTERNIVMFTNVTVQDQASLERDMRTILGYYSGPVVFVSHFNTPTFGGERLEIRDRLARYVSENADELNQAFYNPTDLVEAFGMRAALQDLAHFTPSFERAVAECYWARFCGPLVARADGP
jgi:hypothetical protein